MMNTLGERIRANRRKQGFTQTTLAKGICTPSMISQIESDRARPSFKILSRLAERLEISLDQLITDTELHLEGQSTYKMACSMVAAKEYNSAIPLLKDLQETPMVKIPDKKVLILLGESYLNTDQLQEAENAFYEVLEYALLRNDSYLHATVLEYIGQVEWKRKRYQLADHFWRLSLDLLAKSETVDLRQKARLLTRIANMQAKCGLVQDALCNYEKTLPIYEESNDLHDMGQAYMTLAHTFKKSNDLQKAIEYSEKAFAIFEVLEDMFEKNKVLLSCAVTYGDVGRIDEAITMLESVIRKFQQMDKREEMAMTSLELGKVYLKKGDVKKAEENCLMARALLPERHAYQSWVYRVLGKIANEKGDLEEAVSLLNRAAECFKMVDEFGEWESTMHDLSLLYQQLNEPYRAYSILEDIRSNTRQVMEERGFVL